MKFIILGSEIDNLVNAYFLAKSGHQVTVIEDENKKECAAHDSLSFQFDSILTNNIGEKDLKSKITNLFHKNKFNQKITELILKNKNALIKILETEEITLKNKRVGLLHLYKNNPQNKIRDIKKMSGYQSNYKIFSQEEMNSLGLPIDYKKKIISGAILSQNDLTIDRQSFIDDLKKICQVKYKVKFEKNLEIKNILTNCKKITGIHTDKKVFVADCYIINIDDHNLELLKSININIVPNFKYKIKIFTDIKNIKTPPIKHNLINHSDKTTYHINKDYCKIEIPINKKNYTKIKSTLNWEYCNKINHAILLEIKDYKNIRHFLEKEQYFKNGVPLSGASKKYSNLFLNGGCGNIDFNLSFGMSDLILSKLPN
jgi:D-amino-acid dehydrogenase